jgi:hypothetical protein
VHPHDEDLLVVRAIEDSNLAAMPSFSSPTPCFFLTMPALKAGSKSLASVTCEPGFTRNGSMNCAIRFVMSSLMQHIVGSPARSPET